MNLYQIHRQDDDRTYLAPEFAGTYRECRQHLVDKANDIRIDIEVAWVSLVSRTAYVDEAPANYGSVRWTERDGSKHKLFIRKP